MSFGFGMGFGFGSRGAPVKPKPPVDPAMVCGAIEGRHNIDVTYNGQGVRASPYALIRTSGGVLVLHAVIFKSPEDKLSHWEPRGYDLAHFVGLSVAADCFTPNTLFRSEDVVGDGEILCAVDRDQGSLDSLKMGSSKVIPSQQVEVMKDA
jgi:hypothetical protein